MLQRKGLQRVQVVITRFDALDNKRQQSSSDKDNPRHLSAAYVPPFKVKKEEDDKNALDTLRTALDAQGTAKIIALRVKSEIKQEDMAKAALRANLVYNAVTNRNILLQKLQNRFRELEDSGRSSEISSQQEII
ncbi:hypothetical protein MBANPS3_002196 [Mucor bainieri]